MPITVVTHRDDVGAPTNREVYAAGGTWRIGAAGLEILSTDRRVLGLYPDGNWLSVYADNRVRVHTEGRPEEEPVPRLAGAPESAQPGADPLAAAVTSGTSTSDKAILVPDEILPAERAPAAAAADDDSATFDTVDVEAFDDDSVAALADAGDAEPTETIDRDADDLDSDDPNSDDPNSDEPIATANTADSDRRSAPTRPSSIPPGMRPVAFRPRVIRPARRPEEPSRTSHMRPVVFRARTYRKPDE